MPRGGTLMGARGPAPKPTALVLLEGNPGKRPINKRQPQPRHKPMAAWDNCSGMVDLPALKDLPCYAGLDLSTKLDITALVLVFCDGNSIFHVVPFFWLPGDNLSDRPNQETARYRHWAQQGFISLTEGNVIDFAAIRRRVNELRDQAGLDIRQIAFDPWNAQHLAQQLTEDGFQMIEVS